MIAGAMDWDNFKESLPAYLTISLMPLTYSIANGVVAGMVAFAVIEVSARRRAGTSPAPHHFSSVPLCHSPHTRLADAAPDDSPLPTLAALHLSAALVQGRSQRGQR